MTLAGSRMRGSTRGVVVGDVLGDVFGVAVTMEGDVVAIIDLWGRWQVIGQYMVMAMVVIMDRRTANRQPAFCC